VPLYILLGQTWRWLNAHKLKPVSY